MYRPDYLPRLTPQPVSTASLPGPALAPTSAAAHGSSTRTTCVCCFRCSSLRLCAHTRPNRPSRTSTPRLSPSLPLSHSLSLSLFCFRDPIVTGSSVVAIKYKDGIMMATDTLGAFCTPHFPYPRPC